nr:solute carrier family 22 member 8-like [Manis javanica]
MSVEEFGVNINFLQPIFGEVDIQAKFTTIWTGALPRPLLYSWQEGPSWLSSLCPWTNRYGHKHCVDPRGSLTDPLVKITGKWQPRVPNTIFGTIALLGGSATLFLPETLNQPTPETIEDMETWSLWAKELKEEPEAGETSRRTRRGPQPRTAEPHFPTLQRSVLARSLLACLWAPQTP